MIKAEYVQHEAPTLPAVETQDVTTRWHAVTDPAWLRKQLERSSRNEDVFTANAAVRALAYLDAGRGDRQTLQNSLKVLGVAYQNGTPSVNWTELA